MQIRLPAHEPMNMGIDSELLSISDTDASAPVKKPSAEVSRVSK